MTRPLALNVAQYVQRPRHPEDIGNILVKGEAFFSGLQPPLPIRSPNPSTSPGDTRGASGNLEFKRLVSAVAIHPLTITFFPWSINSDMRLSILFCVDSITVQVPITTVSALSELGAISCPKLIAWSLISIVSP